MKSIQYTIRSISPQLDNILREQSRKTGRSLNEVTLNALQKGVGLSDESTFTDLDDLFGVGICDEAAFNDAMNWLDSLPNDTSGVL